MNVIAGNVEQQATQSQNGLHFPPFPTVLSDVTNRIVSFSDIHGDIDALIVCLRDCAKVIRPRVAFNSETQRDPNLTQYLNMDINNTAFRRDLGYEWVNDDTSFVIIVGDLLDPVRYNTADNGQTLYNEDFYYPQVELKILHFLNALNEDSLRKNIARGGNSNDFNYGRIYKLCGNHEIFNFNSFERRLSTPLYLNQENTALTGSFSSHTFVFKYQFRQDQILANYYETNVAPLVPLANTNTTLGYSAAYGTNDAGLPFQYAPHFSGSRPIQNAAGNWEYTRQQIFAYPNPGFSLYLQTTGTGGAMVINDNLFVHGGLFNDNTSIIHNIRTVATFNTFINTCMMPANIMNQLTFYRNTMNSPMRQMLEERRISTGHLNDQQCSNVGHLLTRFCYPDSRGPDAPDGIISPVVPVGESECGLNRHNNGMMSMRLFLGHSPQHLQQEFTVISGLIDRNAIIETYSNFSDDGNEYYHHGFGQPLHVNHLFHNRISGITFSCNRQTHQSTTTGAIDNPQVIKLDVGMGRGQEVVRTQAQQPHAAYSDMFTRDESYTIARRVPQVIVIPENDVAGAFGEYAPGRLFLIRSTLKNMALHMPRPTYKQILHDKFDLLFDRVVLGPPLNAVSTGILDRVRNSVYFGKSKRKKRISKYRFKKSLRK